MDPSRRDAKESRAENDYYERHAIFANEITEVHWSGVSKRGKLFEYKYASSGKDYDAMERYEGVLSAMLDLDNSGIMASKSQIIEAIQKLGDANKSVVSKAYARIQASDLYQCMIDLRDCRKNSTTGVRLPGFVRRLLSKLAPEPKAVSEGALAFSSCIYAHTCVHMHILYFILNIGQFLTHVWPV